MSFVEIARIEPLLIDLEARARTVADAMKSWDDRIEWWGNVGKPILSTLVGRRAVRLELTTPEAYDCAYRQMVESANL